MLFTHGIDVTKHIFHCKMSQVMYSMVNLAGLTKATKQYFLKACFPSKGFPLKNIVCMWSFRYSYIVFLPRQ
jgi:hypothetical protein